MPPTCDLRELFRRHRVVVCVGAGGVGKTTTAAALALAAASSGRRTLCLTIDPARRLAGSLGLETFPREEMVVPQKFLAEHGVSLRAPLTVMMLDAESTFDDLISRFAASKADAERILEHRVYRHLSRNLAGTQAFMAAEKVLSVAHDDRFDTIILDTPPAARALDFFDAPKRMGEIIGSPATRALISAFGGSRGLSMGLLAAGFRRVVAGMERITGAGLITEVAELMSRMHGLFDGFDERARAIDRSLRSEKFGYVLVTAPHARTLDDARVLARGMEERSLAIGGLVFNRMAHGGVEAALSIHAAHLPDGRPSGLSEAGCAAAARIAQEEFQNEVRQRELCVPLRRSLSDQCLTVFLPAYAEDVHDPRRLMEVSRRLSGQV